MKIVTGRIVNRECAKCTGTIRLREFATDGFLLVGVVYLTPTGITVGWHGWAGDLTPQFAYATCCVIVIDDPKRPL